LLSPLERNEILSEPINKAQNIMNAYIPDKETLEELINNAVSSSVKETVDEALPEAIRKATRKKWLNTDEVMEMLGCSRRHVQHLRDSGRLPFVQKRRTIRYDVDEVEAYLQRGKVEATKEA
jgi:excisionase family DNA binding protein